MNGLALVGHQFRFDQKAFWRNPASVGFTVFFPVLLLVIFGTIFGSDNVEVRGGHIDTDTYYVPAIITMAIISSTMQTLAMSLVIAREDGRLKRGRGTPMPSWVFIAGRVGNSIVTAVMIWWLLRHPEVEQSLLGPEQVKQLVEHDIEGYYSEHAASSFATQVWVNNVWVSAQALIFGKVCREVFKLRRIDRAPAPL